MAFYLKYRPQKIDDLDIERIREQFKQLFSKNNFPHAYLFTGTKGIGKTSTARIIAKVINCEKGASSKKKWEFIEPCNQCLACVSITKGNSLDVIEIDAASNRGIDEMRSLREKISLAPSSLRYKVYIIDEVHMLTTEAFNALLKTLEEPPIHAMFILCTTESYKIPQTILSRCTVVVFSKATQAELLRSLERVVRGEGIKIEDSALKLITGYSEGSFRDAVKTLETISLQNQGNITADTVNNIILAGNIDQKEIINLILEKKAKTSLDKIGNALEGGIDPKQLNRLLLDALRSSLLEHVSKNDKTEIVNISKLIKLLTRAETDIRYSPIGQLPIELAIIEYCYS